ncbi:hypothetical protein HDU87_000617 [Geranomyces variabilis]|uniref:UDP-galactose transporter n=1 Tax=Geranomyces variabilis TaxID=109894 RepID=A0AAD5XM83_9FUNG|nr:hypothetical protein HDU87_000617 [Geranomyces variabilis]
MQARRDPTSRLALAALVVVTSANALVLRKSRQEVGPTGAYSVWQAICLAEILKIALSVGGMLLTSSRPPALSVSVSPPPLQSSRQPVPLIRVHSDPATRFQNWLPESLAAHAAAVFNRSDFIALTIPTFLYMVQNALNFISISHIPAVLFQTVNQTKILTTAVFTILLLKRGPTRRQWFALFVLTAGVVVTEYRSDDRNSGGRSTAWVTGLLAAVAATVLSGFNGVYIERFLKSSSTTLNTRNVQLSMYSAVMTLVVGVILVDGQKSPPPRLFENFNEWTWLVVVLQAASGLVISVVLKYANTILKNFAASVAIVFSSILSYFTIGFTYTPHFVLGTMMIFLATYLYTQRPNHPAPGKMPVLPTTRLQNPVLKTVPALSHNSP